MVEQRVTWLTPPRTEREELLDRPDHAPEDFARSYADIRRINRWLGGVSVVRRELRRLGVPAKATVLDVATGAGDIPAALGSPAVGLDLNPSALAVARDVRGLRLVRGDARSLPFRDGSFDVVTCSLTFHHFPDAEAAEILREMHRVARRAVVVNDLRRAWLPAGLIWMVTRTLRMHPMTRHDAPVSVLRSRTPAEYRALCSDAGFAGEVRSHPFWRASLVVPK